MRQNCRRRAYRAARASAACLALAVAARVLFALTPPTWWVDPARFVQPRDSLTVVDRHGTALRHVRAGGVDRRWVGLDQVSGSYVDAVVATEDARFWRHDGVDVLATARALATAPMPWGRRSGGSTITQQLVKLVYGRPHGLASKAVEMVRAAALERIFTKQQILEQYINRVPFGDRIEGVERASEEYFGHPAATLTVAEAALLAGIPQAPTATEPRRHLGRALARRNHVLARMASTGALDEAARARIAAEVPAVRAVPPRPNVAPRFVDAALGREKAAAPSGLRPTSASAAGPSGLRPTSASAAAPSGLRPTSLDARLQRDAEALVGTAVARFEARGVTNGAAVVVDNETGEILAYVGAARSGPDAPGGELDLLARARQPGSTLKPFVYELFFEHGGTAATVVDDVSRSRRGARGAEFDPKDYDGREHGPVRARLALAGSLNLAALDVAERVGESAVVERLRALGFHGLAGADRYGAAAVLGGVDTTPLDLAGAYVALARGGTRVPLVFTVGEAQAGDRVMSVEAAALARDILSDGLARRDAFGADLTDLAAGHPFALKTGTSSGWRDAWAAVFDDATTVVVWLGDPAGRPLGAVAGFEAAAPVAVRILAAAARGRHGVSEGAARTASADRLVSVSVCADTGLLLGPRCRHATVERFVRGTVPSTVCAAHDEHGELRLPARYADWIRRTHPSGIAIAPRPEDGGDGAPIVREPRDGARWLVDTGRGPIRVALRASAGTALLPDDDVTWEVDGVPLRESSWELRGGKHDVTAIWHGRRSRAAHVVVEASSSRERQVQDRDRDPGG
jgi:penicillin-binding protein 1C